MALPIAIEDPETKEREFGGAWGGVSHETTADQSDMALHPILNLKQENVSPVTKILGGVLILVVIAAVVLAALFMNETSSRRKAITQLAQAQQSRAKLEQQVTDLRAEMKAQSEEIERLAGDLEIASEKAAMIEVVKSQHQEQLEKLKTLAMGQVKELQNAIQERNDRIGTLQKRLQSLESGGDGEMMTEVALPGVADRSSDRLISGPAKQNPVVPKGKVMKVNQEHRFIVINVGPGQGAELGRYVEIYRNKEHIGRARIDRVYQNLSAATVLSNYVIGRVQTGDQIYVTYQ